MRIAFAMINCNRIDGSARPVNEVSERLADAGHEVHLYARTVRDLDLRKVRWHRVPGPGWPEVADFLSYHHLVNQMIRPGAYDIVHSIGCNTLRANVVTIQNIQPAKSKILRQISKDEVVSPARRFTRACYLRVTSGAEKRIYTAGKNVRRKMMFLPVSRGVEAELRDYYSIGDALVRIVPNAADTKIFHPLDSEQKSAWRTEHGFSEKDIVCVFCGSEWARKGLDLALQALARISRPDVKLFVAGEDPVSEPFHEMASNLGVRDRVVFGGFRRDVASVMGACDVFLFPSRYEAFSLASIEAAACGLPVVATRINGTEDLIEPGENGEFVPDDPEGIASVLSELCASRERLIRMGNRAREIVEARYTWDRVASLTESAYQEILQT